jgi:hypothetical protein
MDWQGAQDIGQGVAQAFQLTTQKSIVECKSAIILEDPQSLPGAVGGGVQDASAVDFFGRLGKVQRLVQLKLRFLGGTNFRFEPRYFQTKSL